MPFFSRVHLLHIQGAHAHIQPSGCVHHTPSKHPALNARPIAAPRALKKKHEEMPDGAATADASPHHLSFVLPDLAVGGLDALEGAAGAGITHIVVRLG